MTQRKSLGMFNFSKSFEDFEKTTLELLKAIQKEQRNQRCDLAEIKRMNYHVLESNMNQRITDFYDDNKRDS